jgi:hypothetical protein
MTKQKIVVKVISKPKPQLLVEQWQILPLSPTPNNEL